jgi:hypothetical protein
MLAKDIRKHSSTAIAANALTLPGQWLGSLRLNWAYNAMGGRDLRLDILRGFAIFVMVIDHWGGASLLYGFTGGNKFWVSAAEGFVLLSGLVAGMVYGKIASRENLRAAQIKLLRRAFTLYKLTVALTLIVTAFAVITHSPWADDLPLENPAEFIFNVITLHQVIAFTDIPMLYTFLLLAATLALWFMHTRRALWLLIGSGALWWFAFSTKMYLPWQVNGGYAFNPGAWQFLFILAMVIGYHWDALKSKLNWVPRVSAWILATLLVALLIQFYNSDITFFIQLFSSIDLPNLLYEAFRKIALGPGRLLVTLLFFAFGYLTLTLLWRPLSALLGWLLTPLGQNSLYGYTLHVALVGIFTVVAPRLPVQVTEIEIINTGLQLAAILAIWILIQRRVLFNIIPR